jgi:hypothetical protein
MKRRKALKLTAAICGGTIAGSGYFLSGCKNNETTKGLFSAEDIALMDDIGETILPATADSPGAKAARIGDFMKTIVTDCYSEKEQQAFLQGLGEIKRLADEVYQHPFRELTPSEKKDLLSGLDRDAPDIEGEEIPHYFSMMKQLTIWGYFTSEPGATRALRYNPVPGRYLACIPYKVGDKAWAE